MTWTPARFLSAFALVALFAAPVRSGGAQAAPGRAPGAGRQLLEERFNQRMQELVRRRLQLTDDQMSKLQASNGRFAQQRLALFTREGEIRRELRQQLMAGDSANQTRVGELLDQTMRLQRQRLDLADSEQRELAKFLRPVQRARYFGLQTEMRKRMQQLGERGRNQPLNRRPQQRRNRPPL